MTLQIGKKNRKASLKILKKKKTTTTELASRPRFLRAEDQPWDHRISTSCLVAQLPVAFTVELLKTMGEEDSEEDLQERRPFYLKTFKSIRSNAPIPGFLLALQQILPSLALQLAATLARQGVSWLLALRHRPRPSKLQKNNQLLKPPLSSLPFNSTTV